MRSRGQEHTLQFQCQLERDCRELSLSSLNPLRISAKFTHCLPTQAFEEVFESHLFKLSPRIMTKWTVGKLLATLEIRMQLGYNPKLGGVSEWPMEAVLKTAPRFIGAWVRIPPPPPRNLYKLGGIKWTLCFPWKIG
jgi:hypothetical protein